MGSETQELVLKRLATLIGENKDADNGLQSRLSTIEQQISSLAAAISNSGGKQPSGNDSDADDNIWPQRKSKPKGDDIAALVNAAVQDAIAPVVKKFTERDQADIIKNQQQASFNAAVAQYPDLKDPASDLSQMADKLYQNRLDLASLPDAPMIISSMAKGILADTRAVNAEVREHKRNAAVQDTKPVGNLTLDSLSEDRDRATQAKDLKEKVIEKTQQEGTQVEDFADLFRLNLEQKMAERSSEE